MPTSPHSEGTPTVIDRRIEVPEGLGYRLKRRLLGPALTSEQLAHERLSKPMALGVLSSDCISSSAYGSEQMLRVLLPAFGIVGFTILLPLTGFVLLVLAVVTLCYREVVMVYTRAGGSYVVARDNFGPRVAQVAAVALLLDYIVTVAVQAAAGTTALSSAFPVLEPWKLHITVGVVVLLFYGNLRGIREAGRAFAFPTYFFVGSILAVILVGIGREIFGSLPTFDVKAEGAMAIGDGKVLTALGFFYLLRAFANGGSSLTGLEAISDGVSAFRKPEGVNARRTLVIMSVTLGTLVAGISWLAHVTRAMPYEDETPTVISQVARAVLGDGAIGHGLFLVVQLATMLILYTGANTPFNGFPFLASFVASDSFLPRQLTKRGHRLAFSNGIIVLAVVSISLLLATGARVESLVAFYAIGVFTGFGFAGLGMARRFRARREDGWRWKVAVNLTSGYISVVVVIIFAIAKFTEGAWLVLVIVPILWFGLIRLNQQYAQEADALDKAPPASEAPNFARHVVLVLVDNLDLATLRAMRYARSLKPTQLRAVHFVIDSAHAANLSQQWAANDSVSIPLEMIECPDRRLSRAALELSARLTRDARTEVTLLLPRRTYSALLGRLLHDRTADDIADTVSKIPHVAATIVPFNVRHALSRSPEHAGAAAVAPSTAAVTVGAPIDDPLAQASTPSTDVQQAEIVAATTRADGSSPIGSLGWRDRATVVGKIASVRLTPVSDTPALTCELFDDSGGVNVIFYGRRQIAGVVPGALMRVTGRVGNLEGELAIANPSYELLAPGS